MLPVSFYCRDIGSLHQIHLRYPFLHSYTNNLSIFILVKTSRTLKLNLATLSFMAEPQTITFVLVSFTIIILSQQKLSRPSNCFCSLLMESVTSIKSSAHKMWAMMVLPRQTPTSLHRYSSRSAKYLRNKRPLTFPPWFTPIWLGIGGLIRPLTVTLNTFWYRNILTYH